MRTLDDVDLAGKRVLVRVDFNVPLDDAARDHRRHADPRRAADAASACTTQGCALVLAAHLGRPKGMDPAFSLRPAADRLAELTGWDVTLAPGVVGEPVEALAGELAARATC